MKANSSTKEKLTVPVENRGRQKVANEFLHKVLIQAPAIICMFRGPDHTYEFANEKYLQLIGRTDIIGKTIREVLPELEGQKFFEILDGVYKTGESFIGNEVLAKLDRGGKLEDCFFNFIYQAIHDEKERIEGILVHAVEVTEEVVLRGKLKEREKELIYQIAEKEKRALELMQAVKELALQNGEKENRASELVNENKELEAFAYVASHDLQEPLRKIQTFSDRILVNENLSDKGKDYLEWMQDAALRMRMLIQDLLAFSQLTDAERKFETIDLSLIVDEVKTELTHLIQEKRATIEITESCSANVIVFQFRQLMNNLISNALKFSSPARPPHIQIACRIVTGNRLIDKKISTAGAYCHITVKDNGIGFEPQFSEQIFGAFQKLHGKEVYAGTGIGLTIVKKIVDNHHGIITATGEVDKGATFDIYIPLISFKET